MQLSECVQACTHKQITQEQFNIWCLRENKQLHLVLLGQHEGNMTKTLSRTFGGISEMFPPLLLQAAAPEERKRKHVPAEVCLNFSVFFFLHFQGFRRRPRVANLLRRRLGGVWPPGMTDSERMADSLSTSSAARREKKQTGLSEAAQVQKFWRRHLPLRTSVWGGIRAR